MHKNSFKFVI